MQKHKVMTVFNVISMFGGLALFLYGMRIMGDGLKKESTGSFKSALEKVTGSPFMGFTVGAGLTALIQSATATIVIVSGLVGAGIMGLSHSVGVIFGANVGSTITGQIIRLLDVDASGTQWLNVFKPSTLAPVAAVIGIVFIMFVKKKNAGTIGTIAMGFGILFTGLLSMTNAVAPLSESESFARMFTSFGDRPLLGFLAGLAVAFILQSSSATIGILQALSVTGAITFSSVFPILLGIYMGDGLTTLIVCSIGTKADTKRTGMINMLYNISCVIMIIIAVNLIHAFGGLGGTWDSVLNSGGIANTHTVFKLSTAILLLPLAKPFEKASRKLVKDDNNLIERGAEIKALDTNLYKSPALALNSAYKALCAMNDIVDSNVFCALDLTHKYDPEMQDRIQTDELYLDQLEDAVNVYLAGMTPYLGLGLQEDIQNYYLQCVTDFERAGDHVYSIACCGDQLREKEKSLSDAAIGELNKICVPLRELLDHTALAFRKQNQDAARMVEPYVVAINEMTKKCRDNHMERMANGVCDTVSGSIYMDILMHLGRIADMCSNIAIHTLMRHNSSIENYEHIYMASVHGGSDENYNRLFSSLEEKYIKTI